jgi:hypothetical protein
MQDDTLYIHWRYRPSDIGKNVIRQIYNKKTRDILRKMDLPHISGKNVSDLLQKSLETHKKEKTNR